MGQPSERLPLQNKKVATPIRNNTMSEECGTSCFRGQVTNLFASIPYQDWFDKNMYERNE